MPLLLLLCCAGPQQLPPLEVGQTLRAEISVASPEDSTPAVAALQLAQALRGGSFEFELTREGTFSLELHSNHFDAYLVLRDAQGEVLAEDDDGLWNTHARIALDLPAGNYQVQACALKGRTGAFTLSLREGARSLPTGAAKVRIELDDHLEAARVLAEEAGEENLAVADKLNRAALLHHRLGEYAQAVDLAARSLAIRQGLLPENHQLVLESLGNLAGLHSLVGNSQESIRLMEEVVQRLRSLPGDHDREIARNLNNLGLILQRQDRFEEALAAIEEAVTLREKVLGSRNISFAISVNNLALLHFRIGNYADAETLYRRSIAILEEVAGAEHIELANVLSNLGSLLKAKGNYEEAQDLLERAVRIREKELGPDHLNTATSVEQLASLLRLRARYTESRELYERVLRIRQQRLPAGHLDLARSWNNLGVQLSDEGNLAGALASYQKALDGAIAASGPRHSGVARYWANLGRTLRQLGRFEEARKALDQALAIYQERFGADHPDTIHTMISVGVLALDQGDPLQAESVLRQAVNSGRLHLSTESVQMAEALSGLGQALRRQQRFDESLTYYQEAQDVWKKIVGETHPSYAIALNNLAILYLDMGRPNEVLSLLQQAHQIWLDSYGTDHPDLAKARYNLASFHLDLGHTDEALRLISDVIQVRERILGRIHPDTVEGLTLLGRTLWLAQRSDEAAVHAIDAADRLREYMDLHLARLPEVERFQLLDKMKESVGGALFLAVGSEPAYRRRAAEALLTWKGWAGEAALRSRDQLQTALDPAQLQTLDELRGINSKLSAVLTAQPLGADQINVLVTKREKLERQLVSVHEFSSQQRTSFEQMQTCLEPSEAALDLVVLPPNQKSMVQAWLTTAAMTEPRVFDLGRAPELEKVVQDFLRQLVSTRGGRTLKASDPPAQAAYQALFAPLSQDLEGVNAIYLSPDSFLGGLPFEVLQQEDGRFLIERFSFVYLQDLASLPGLKEKGAWLPLALGPDSLPPSLLAVGGVDYGSPAPSRADLQAGGEATERFGGRYWQPLPWTGPEVRSVSAMHQQQFGDVGQRMLMLGDEPSEDRLQAAMPGYEVLHLATHGFFDPSGNPGLWEEAPDESGAIRYRLKPGMEQLVGRMPGLLSGLILSGANQRIPANAEDGYLTAEEVLWLDLSRVRLAVLSACESGLGRARPGEGMIGLRRAFRLAGADTVISSLWEVNDVTTSRLMSDFYVQLWVHGLPVGAALRQAQLSMLKRNRLESSGHGRPSSWGAFVLAGSWR